MGQRGKTQLDDLLGALADLTLNTQTSVLLPAVIQDILMRVFWLLSAPLSYLDLWGKGGQVEGEHRRGSRGQKVDAV